jgi:hypothetical protein
MVGSMGVGVGGWGGGWGRAASGVLSKPATAASSSRQTAGLRSHEFQHAQLLPGPAEVPRLAGEPQFAASARLSSRPLQRRKCIPP